jgi:hypothetical protein
LNKDQIYSSGLNDDSYYPGGGASFSINRETFKILYDYLKNNNNPFIYYNSDISIGVWLNKCGMTNYIHSDLLGFTTPIELKHDKERINQNISYHYCSREIFYELKNNY